MNRSGRYILGSLFLIVAINAFGGGYYGLAGARDIPTEWLEGSPFSNYVIPSLVLFIGVGGSCLSAAVLVFRRHIAARSFSMFTAAVMLGWIIAQVTVIGYVSWMQPAIAMIAVVCFLLSLLLPKRVSVKKLVL